MYLETFPCEFHETCETPPHLIPEKITLCLPEAINTEGYKIVADKTPCIVRSSLMMKSRSDA